MARVGVDVGGTNTDLVLEAEHGVFVHKVASTPHDQSEGVLKGLRELCEISKVRPDDVSLIVHGTTVATNITIEHTGAEVGMLTTRNFRDILHIGRHKRPYNFSLHFEVPWQQRPLVKRRNRIAITERILPPDGTVEVALDEKEVAEAIKLFKRRGIKSVVIGFLFSFLNDAHERRAAELVRAEMPDAYICTSSEVANVIREYERFSTAAMNGFVGPKTSLYLNNLQRQAESERVSCQSARHSIERRHCHRRDLFAKGSGYPDVGPGRRRDRRPGRGPVVRPLQPHHRRHRRHLR